jgi:hypothetical protein
VELQRTIMPDERYFQYKEVSDSKPGKIKKTFTIMAFTSRVVRKTVEDAEIFQVSEESTDSDVTIFHLRKMKVVMNLTVMKMDNWMTILKQIKKEAPVLT